MFIGHFGAGMAAKKLDKTPSLGTLFMAAQWIDLVWPVFVLLGIERIIIEPYNIDAMYINFIYYPFTHSFLAAALWGVLFGGIYYLIKKDVKSSLVLGGLVLSHWFLDLIVHKPDLPLFPWESAKVGLGLWYSKAGTIIVEGAIFIAGTYLYTKSTRPKQRRKGTKILWGLLLFLIVIYVMNLFGPPPEDPKMIGYVGLSQWLIIAWGYWIDRHRVTTEPSFV